MMATYFGALQWTLSAGEIAVESSGEQPLFHRDKIGLNA